MSKDFDVRNNPIHTMRRKELACDDDWIGAFLSQAQVGHIATRWDVQPFITPTLFWYDAGRHAIYFHSATAGRLHANVERHEQVCFEASRSGDLLPSNVALEFSIQYESVVAFGKVRIVEDDEDKRRALYGLIGKYFPTMVKGEDYRPITDAELKITSVFMMIIESWSGKRHWSERADQSEAWAPLDERWFAG